MPFQTPRGTRDIEPEEMIRYEYVLSVIKKVFEKYGFDPFDTPAFEDWALLSAKQGGGEEIKQEIYYFKDKSDRELGLRFDLTVPLCRFVAANPDIPKPFRRYQIGKVWRYDKPGALRWREFLQADIDIVGSESTEAEAEYLLAICEIFSELGFRDFVIRINNRKITEDFVKALGIKNVIDVFRSIDKLEKIGAKAVEKELTEKGISSASIKRILEFVQLKDIDKVKKQISSEGINEIEKILAFLADYKKNLQVDMSLVRGLEYYTGPVFEIATGAGISVGGGGRYDNLIEIFGGKKTPATGISIGIDRLVAVMSEKKMFPAIKTATKVFVVSVSEAVKKNVVDIVKNLRNLSIPAEFDLMGRSLSKQLSYVNSREIPFVLVIGEKELASGKAKMRDMTSGKETDVWLDKLEDVKEIVASKDQANQARGNA
ncbi:MAG: histidine--tRNA ligase [Candidatus Aenigmarchaeota archaeon]|nr:histidine--tRNA ligase [Candidatus Aenigmarchaeota archaeon]